MHIACHQLLTPDVRYEMLSRSLRSVHSSMRDNVQIHVLFEKLMATVDLRGGLGMKKSSAM